VEVDAGRDGEGVTAYQTGGPPRFKHQRAGLNKLIGTGGLGALLFDPGLGKTATVLDYAGLLAIKSPIREARVLVVAPLAAVDTWVIQAEKFVSPMVSFWAEALGGSLLERAETLASRGGNPVPISYLLPGRPRFICWAKTPKKNEWTVSCDLCSTSDTRVGIVTEDDLEAVRWWMAHQRSEHPETIAAPAPPRHAPRALHHEQALAWNAVSRHRERPLTPTEGPDGLGTQTPRLILEVINIDTLQYRNSVIVNAKTRARRAGLADIMVDAIQRFNPDLVVVDESHKIKASMGNASRLLSRCTKFVKRRVLLTGTVMPHGPLDVFGQWRFLDPYAFGDPGVDGSKKQATFGGFKSRYAVLGGWMGKEVIAYRNLDEMQAIMSKNAIVARKRDALDLPPETDVEVPVNLTPAESKAYVEMRDQLAVQLSNGQLASAGNRLTQMLRLRQITAGVVADDMGKARVIGTSKVDTIRSIVYDTLVGEKRIVVFAYFTPEIDALEKVLQPRRNQGEPATEIMVIAGATPQAQRLAMRKRFGPEGPQDKRIVMVAQIKTMSLAVNELITASHAIFGSLSQQRDDLIQARDRLSRIGQTRPMTFWYAVAPGTVDEVILKSHRERTDLEDAMLKHIQTGGVSREQRLRELSGGNELAAAAIHDALVMGGFA
jgi:SNF2 family DNA or RNA helicase